MTPHAIQQPFPPRQNVCEPYLAMQQDEACITSPGARPGNSTPEFRVSPRPPVHPLH